MSDTPISPGAGAITASGVALKMALLMAPLVGALSFGGVAPANAISMATLPGAWSVAGAAPVLTNRTVTAIVPTVGAVALAGVAPGNTQKTNSSFVPLVGALTCAGVASTVSQQDGPTVSVAGPGQVTATWNLVNLQSGTRMPLVSGYGTVFTQVTGTFGSGGSVQMEGSNDGFNWVKLSPTALTSAGFFAALGVNERPKYVRPNCTAGDATTNLTIVSWFSS